MSDQTERNPYRPGVGTRPLHLAGREREIRRFESALGAAPEIPANVRLTGLRGVGKTVLLSEFDVVGQEEGWLTAGLELQPRHNREEALSQLVVGSSEHARDRLSRITRVRRRVSKGVRRSVGKLGVQYGDLTFTFEPRESAKGEDVARALFDTAEASVSAGRAGFLLLLDEAQVLRDDRSRTGEHPLSLLIAAVSGLQKAEVPVGLVVCGLPTLVSNLLAARTYTERMFRGEEIGSLERSAAEEAFVEPLRKTSVTAERSLVGAVLDTVEGYPYFIQLWGAELWDAAKQADLKQFTVDLLKEVEPEIYRRLDIDFYDPRVQTLTPAEQDLLLSTAQCSYPPLLVSELNSVSEKAPGNVNVLLGRLVEAGVLYRIRKGQYEYTAPKFYEYLQRRVHRS